MVDKWCFSNLNFESIATSSDEDLLQRYEKIISIFLVSKTSDDEDEEEDDGRPAKAIKRFKPTGRHGTTKKSKQVDSGEGKYSFA